MELKQYQEVFEKLKRDRQGDASWLLRLREEAMKSFMQKGFPTPGDEAWRYTDVTTVLKTAFDLDEGAPEISPETVKTLKPKNAKNFLLVVNGKFSHKYSFFETGIEVMGLEEAVTRRMELVEPYLGRGALPSENGFCALNTALFSSGLLIDIPEEMTLKEPLYVVFFTDPAKERAMFFPRNLIVIGEGSKAALVETHISGNGKSYLTDAITEIFMERGAILDHVKIQRENEKVFHIAATRVLQHHASSFSSFSLSTGGQLARNEYGVLLEEEGAVCTLNGLCLGDKDQLLDHQTFVDHRKPDGKSHQLFKGLMAGNSRGVFDGRVIVRQDAQKTDAHQTYKGLLFSDTAKIDAQPQLEILADDVKCSHGVAIGQLQEDEVFYLRSRGIGEKEAGHMLARGFAMEVIERPELEFLEETLTDLVSEKLEKQFRTEYGDRSTAHPM